MRGPEISSRAHPGARRLPLARALVWLGLALGVAFLVAADPLLSDALPAALWRAIGLAHSPLRLLPLVAVLALAAGAGAGIWALGRVSSFERMALVLIFAASQFNGLGAGPVDVFDVTIFGLLLAWIVKRGMDTSHPVRLSPLLFLASMLMVLTIAHMPLLSPVTWFIGLFGIVRIALIAFLLVDLCRSQRLLEFAHQTMIWAAVFSALVGIAQFILALTGTYYFTLIVPPVSAFKPTPFGFMMRASAFAITAQHFSSFLIYALPVVLWRFSLSRRLGEAVAVAAIFAGIIVSMNFGAIFAAMLVFAIFPFLRWPRLSIHLGLIILGLVSLAYFTGVLQLVYDLSFGDAGVAKGVDQRKTLFELGLEQIARHPLIGTGVRGFGDVDGNFWNRPVHNLFAQAMTELGPLAVAIFVAIFFYLSLELGRLVARGGAAARFAGIQLLMLMAGLLLGMSEPNLDQSNFWIMLALCQATVLIFRPARQIVMRD